MDDLAAFITARLDEDEAMAHAAAQAFAAEWRSADRGVFNGGVRLADAAFARMAAHIARHDPARVLREAAAKRAIVAAHRPVLHHDEDAGSACCAAETAFDVYAKAEPWPCPTIRAIAAVWSDHPDYRAQWAPGHG